ncbi:MAG: hypothetical protein AAF810_20375 [Cyanobacteria bacterium P01_D01_bin.36]
MNRTVKLILDVGIGAVVPVLILNNLNEQLGTVTTYITAAMVSVTWIALSVPEIFGFWAAVVFVRRAMFSYLPREDDKEQDESDFWQLLRLSEMQKLDESCSVGHN